jgi:hypothetical protein
MGLQTGKLVEADETAGLPSIRGLVRLSSMTFVGIVDLTVTHREFCENLGSFRERDEQRLRRNPTLHGIVHLKWTFNAEGEVLIAVPINGTGDSRIGRCVATALEHIPFSPLAGASETPLTCALTFERVL